MGVMNSKAFWTAMAVVVLLLGALNVVLGVNLLPSPEEAREKGTTVPLIITWILVGVGVATSATLAGMLIVATRRHR